jgi:hypothetical protein
VPEILDRPGCEAGFLRYGGRRSARKRRHAAQWRGRDRRRKHRAAKEDVVERLEWGNGEHAPAKGHDRTGVRGVFVAYLPVVTVVVRLPAIQRAPGASTAQLSRVSDAFVLRWPR